jgi:hypothetical protein
VLTDIDNDGNEDDDEDDVETGYVIVVVVVAGRDVLVDDALFGALSMTGVGMAGPKQYFVTMSDVGCPGATAMLATVVNELSMVRTRPWMITVGPATMVKVHCVGSARLYPICTSLALKSSLTTDGRVQDFECFFYEFDRGRAAVWRREAT